MPEPLPSGWTDTGVSISVTVSGSAQIDVTNGDITGGTSTYALLNEWKLHGTGEDNFDPGCPVGFQVNAQRYVSIEGPFGSSPLQVEDLSSSCNADGSSPVERSQVYDFTETAGPYRLGVKMSLIGSAAAPQFARDYKIEYAWFWDENTANESEFGGQTSGVRYPVPGGVAWQSSQPTGMTPEQTGLLVLQFGGQGNILNTADVFLTALTVGSAVDTSGLDEGPDILEANGSGGATVTRRSGGQQATASAGLPWTLAYDIDVLDASGSSTGAQVDTQNQGTVTGPYSATATFRNVSWAPGDAPASYEALSVNATWAAARTPAAWDATDLFLRLWCAPALSNPNAAASYTPVTVTLEDVLDVHRPDGNTPSSFVASSADITVTENAGDSEFAVSATGSYVRREFGETGTDLPAWRKWLGVGASGKADAAFNPDKTHWTKHASGEDIWDWSSYGYLRLTINAPTADDLTLTLEGVQLSVSDSHVTGSDRTTDFTVTETAYTKTWTVPLSAGANTVLIDLLFPNEGGPYYHGRIDAVKFSGFAVGTYTLSGMDLVSCTDPSTVGADEVYLKCLFRSFGQRSGDYDALHAAHNGAACLAATTDRTQCSELFGNDGRGLRYITVSTGSGTGFILDSQLALENFWLLLNEVEGWTVTYSAAAYEAANEDAYGSALAPELAEWTDDLPGNTLTAGSSSGITARPKCGRLYPVPGHTFLIRTRDIKGSGAIEVLAATADGARGGSGEDVPILRQDTAATYLTAVTDAHGFALGTPLPANGSFAYDVGSDSITLRQRDRVRAVYVLTPTYLHSDLIQLVGVPWWFRSVGSGTSALVACSKNAGVSWSTVATIAGGLETGTYPSSPTLARTRWDEVFLASHNDSGQAKLYLSTDLGASFSLHATHAGLRYPRVAVLPERTWLVGHDGTRLCFYTSDDYLATKSEVTALRITCPVQLAAFRVDRRGWLHVLYVDSGDTLYHVYSEDGAAWSATETVATGAQYPAWAHNTPLALALWFESTTLKAGKFEDDYHTFDALVTAPSGTWTVGYVGLDAGTRDEFLVTGQVSAAQVVRYTDDAGASAWGTPS